MEVSELYQVLSERVDEGETDIQAEVEALQHQVDALGTPKPELALPPLIERDEVKASTQALELLVTGTSQSILRHYLLTRIYSQK